MLIASFDFEDEAGAGLGRVEGALGPEPLAVHRVGLWRRQTQGHGDELAAGEALAVRVPSSLAPEST